jgi:hypothetical protein
MDVVETDTYNNNDATMTPLSAIVEAFEELSQDFQSKEEWLRRDQVGHLLRRLLFGLRSFWLSWPRFQVRRVGIRFQGSFFYSFSSGKQSIVSEFNVLRMIKYIMSS